METTKEISMDVRLTILKPVAEVFAAVLVPAPFFVEKASAPLETGKTVQWKFPELNMQIPITVLKVEPQKLIRFEWGSDQGGQNLCEFVFSSPKDHNPQAVLDAPAATTVSITESGWPDTPQGRASSDRNLMGWTHMLCALKAYLEYGANLRKGAFLHMTF